MKIVFAQSAWDDYVYWQQADQGILTKINALIRDVRRQPYRGLGKPEPLRHHLAGFWSRRIDREHRLVYKVESDTIYIAQCRFHYGR